MIVMTSVTPTSGWREHALCRGIDPGIFHPDDEDDPAQVAGAKDVCFQCPVREACLEHSISVREKHGVWGGLTSRERRRLVRRRRRAS
jgi:WhiB family redox-sensing transcriptional regulator